MQITERRIPDTDVLALDVTGHIADIGEVDLLREKVDRLTSRGEKCLLLNLAKVPHVTPVGLAEISRCHTVAQNAGARLALVNMTNGVAILLATTKLLTVFENFDDEDDAVASLAS